MGIDFFPSSVSQKALWYKIFFLFLSKDFPFVLINLRLLQLIITFYRNFFIASTAITICCVWLFNRNGITTFFPLFWFKIVTLALIFYFIKEYKKREIFYYNNLGISQNLLWFSTLSFDLILFIVSLIITYKINAA